MRKSSAAELSLGEAARFLQARDLREFHWVKSHLQLGEKLLRFTREIKFGVQ